MSAPKVYTPTDVTVTVIGESADPEVLAQVERFLAAPPSAPLTGVFYAAPAGHDDPLLPAVTRFVAARPAIGRGALVRWFGVGRYRAGRLLEVLRAQRVCLGYPARNVYRVNPHAWAALPVPSAAERRTWHNGVLGELDQFAACGSLEQVQRHVWFVESLLTCLQTMGWNAAEVAPYQRHLIRCAGVARRRLVPRWREAAPGLFAADFFGGPDVDMPEGV